MSSFLVSDDHLNAVVSAGALHRVKINLPGCYIDMAVPSSVRLVASMLHTGNAISCGEPVDVNYTFKAYRVYDVPVVQLIKLCQSMAYQCEDSQRPECVTAVKICEAIAKALIYNLPGYSEAKWCI